MPTLATPTVAQHFAGRAPAVRQIYDRLLAAAKANGRILEDPKKTSIHLVRQTAFAGVATRQDALILTLKSATDLRSPRIAKREQASAHRWHLEVRFREPSEVDREVQQWIAAAFDLAG